MNKFPWNCGECPLLHTYDMSVDDLTYVCLWSKAQIDDCDRYESAECPLDEHDAKVRAEALEDALSVVEWDGYTLDIKKRIEQLKEQKNDTI